jgi:RNA polymerase primary sigma factor
MNDLDFSFEQSPWELTLSQIKTGSVFSAARFLALLEGESEDVYEDALLQLREKQVQLDISDLPLQFGDGQNAARLRREHQLIQNGMNYAVLEETDPLRLYLEELAGVPAWGDENLLAEKLLAGEEVTEQLTALLLGLVWQRATEMTGRGILLLDLIQEGNVGLLEAICDYQGGDIRSHCDRSICFAMAKAVMTQARASGVGQKMRQALEDYRTVDERLLTELGRNATMEEIAEAMHMTVEQAKTVADMFAAAQLVQKAAQPEPETTPEDDQAVEDTAYFQMRQRIADLLADLSSREVQLLTMRFGLEGGKPMTPEQTAAKLGMTPEEVVAMEAAALSKLRKA